MPKKTRTSKKARTSTARRPPAPPLVAHLVSRFLATDDKALIDGAYQRAAQVLALRQGGEPFDAILGYVEDAGEPILRERCSRAALDEDSSLREERGAIVCAYGEPAFALGFALAYQLLVEKGCAR